MTPADRCEGAATPALAALGSVGARLTPREAELVALAAQALNNGEVAERLGLSVRTVENHLSRADAKLGVRGRARESDTVPGTVTPPSYVWVVLTPAQLEVLEVLRGDRDTRPTVDPGLRDELRFMLEEPLLPLADLVPDGRLVLGKTHLNQALACEAYHLAEQATDFTWNVRSAKGTVAHKAIELSVHLRGEPTPLDLVDHALASLADADDGRSVGAFLQQIGEVERAELRSEAGDMVSRFVELWPPLRKAWVPCTESSVSAELLGGRILLRGKVDLTLGRPVGHTAGRLVIDLKSSGHRPEHVNDLRLYALLDTLRTGVPPFRVAGYALDAGTFLAEDVTFGVLEAAVRRTVAGVTKIIELRAGARPPTETPGPACGWCPRRTECDGPAAWEASRALD